MFGGAFLVNLLQVEVEGVAVGFGRGGFTDAILAGAVAVLDLGGVEVAGVVLVRGADERVLVQSRGVGDENLLAGLGRIVGLHVVGQVDGDGRLPTRGHAVISSVQRSITDLDGDVVVEVKPRGKGIDDLEDVIRVFGGVRNLGLELEVHLAADLGAVALLVGIDGLVDGRVFGLQIDVLGRGGDVDKHRIRVARVGSGTGLRAHHVVAKREVLKSSDVGVTGGLRHRCRTHRRDIVASILGPVGSLGGELGQFRVLVRLLQTVYVVVGLFGDVGIGHIRDTELIRISLEEIVPGGGQRVGGVLAFGIRGSGEHLVGFHRLAVERGIRAGDGQLAGSIFRGGGGGAEAGDAEHRGGCEDARRYIPD